MDRGACCRLLSMGSQRVGDNWATSLSSMYQLTKIREKNQYLYIKECIKYRTLLRISFYLKFLLSVQFSSVTQNSLTLCDPMNCSRPGFPVHHLLLELAQIYVHWAGDAIQPSHPLLSHSPPAFNLSQHHTLFQWVTTLHQVAKILELQL